MVNDWNALPHYVVESESVVKFEANLDRAWERQELKYNYKAKIKRSSNVTEPPPPARAHEIVNDGSELDPQA